MKKIFLIILVTAAAQLRSQGLFNSGFENWNITTTYSSDTVPDQWWSMFCNTTHMTTDAVHGNYATRLQAYLVCGIAPGMMVNGQNPGNSDPIASGSPWITKPAGLSGSYKFTDAMPGDSAEVTVILKRYNTTTHQRDTVALGYSVLAPTNVYSTYSLTINDLMPGVDPDSVVIIFNSSKYNLLNTTTWQMPSLYIDKLYILSGVAGIGDDSSSVNGIAMPNPFSDETMIRISSPLKGRELTLRLYDCEGRMVREEDVKGEEHVLFKRGELKNGVYMYTLSDKKGLAERGKLIAK